MSNYFPDIKRVCIYDIGGVGGYFGGRIAEAIRNLRSFEWHNDPLSAIWEKYIFIATFGIVSAFTGKSLGAIMEIDEHRNLVRGIMEETCAIYRKKFVYLSEDIIEKSMNKAYNFPYEARTSYQRDIESKGSLDNL